MILRLKVYLSVVGAAAAAAVALVWGAAPDLWFSGTVVTAILVMAPLSWYLDKRALAYGAGSFAMGPVFLLTALLLWGPQPAFVLTLTWLFLPLSWERRLLTIATLTLALTATWLWVRHVDLADLSGRHLVLLCGGLAAFWLTNVVLLSGSRMLTDRTGLRAYLRQNVWPVSEEYILNLLVAVLGVLSYRLAGWAGAFLAATMLFARIRSVEKSLELRAHNELSIRSLIAAIEARDPYTHGHSDRVAGLAKRFAEFLHLRPEQVSLVWDAGRLHDVGKIGIPDGILTKEGRLTDEEYTTVKTHPLLGERILSSHERWRDLAEITGQHHEWFNGSGYPRGLRGREIRMEAQILSVVDAYDAMTSTRSYRSAREPATALSEILRSAGSQFDPVVAQRFVAMMWLQLKEESARGRVGA